MIWEWNGVHIMLLDHLQSVAIPSLPSGKNVGDQIHNILEIVDTSVRPLRDEVSRAVKEKATSSLLRGYHEPLTNMLTRALETPFGGAFGDVERGLCPTLGS